MILRWGWRKTCVDARPRERDTERRETTVTRALRTLHVAAARDAVGYILLFLRVINFDSGELFLEFLHCTRALEPCALKESPTPGGIEATNTATRYTRRRTRACSRISRRGAGATLGRTPRPPRRRRQARKAWVGTAAPLAGRCRRERRRGRSTARGAGSRRPATGPRCA